MTVPYVALLLYVGGPHDGHTKQERGLPLELGDCVSCDCHEVVYEFRGVDENGFHVVEYAPGRASVMNERKAATECVS